MWEIGVAIFIEFKIVKNIDIGILKQALQETAQKRETINNIENYSEILRLKKFKNSFFSWIVFLIYHFYKNNNKFNTYNN